jgi:DNA mismatch endonuclease (patch repair protein)
LLRRALWKKGVRYRVDTKQLPGRPDISIKKYRLAIFVDGEFWHGYNWNERKTQLKTNRRFWVPKIERNMQRDREVNRLLEEMGYTVFRFWEGELKNELQTCVNDILVHILLSRDRP